MLCNFSLTAYAEADKHFSTDARCMFFMFVLSSKKYKSNKKFWEELIAYFSLIRYRLHIKKIKGYTQTLTVRCLAMIDRTNTLTEKEAFT
jgi:hypothetical protein